jgi:hypothetical protein
MMKKILIALAGLAMLAPLAAPSSALARPGFHGGFRGGGFGGGFYGYPGFYGSAGAAFLPPMATA